MGLKLKTASNGSVSLEPTNTASDYTLTVPAQTGTVVATDASGNVTLPNDIVMSQWHATLNRAWDGYPSISVYNDTGVSNGEFRIHGSPGTAGSDYSINLRVDGKYLSGVVSQTNAVSSATAVTVATTTPTAVASVTITTTGKPVLLVATGDGNPNQTGGWHRAAIYRGETRVSKWIISENAGGNSVNGPFAVCHIDATPTGTHTFSLRVWQGSGSFTFGEEGNEQAPTILAMEIL